MTKRRERKKNQQRNEPTWPGSRRAYDLKEHMTPEQRHKINTTIGSFEGYHLYEKADAQRLISPGMDSRSIVIEGYKKVPLSQFDESKCPQALPDYTSDLQLMRHIERIMSREQRIAYKARVKEITKIDERVEKTFQLAKVGAEIKAMAAYEVIKGV